MPSPYDLTRGELEELLGDQPAFRARQVWDSLHTRVLHPGEMTDLPVALRSMLEGALPRALREVSRRSADDGQTTKWLWALHDGAQVETVLMHYPDRVTVCVSTQAGCAMACQFCATGQAGFQRQLSAGEIVEQVAEAIRAARPRRLSNVVFMGMGEPLMNWRNVDIALSLLNDPAAIGIGARHITVSTVGVLPGIQALAARPEQFRLAISVHAPLDELRQKLMPINTKFPLADVIAAARTFVRRVTFEYVLLGGVNDTPDHAVRLAALAAQCGAFVNLIPLHPGGSRGFSPSTPAATAAFARALRARSVEVAIRKSRGLDISAACGQLRVERLGRRPPARAHEDADVHVA
jgi:23S rRNA (adenine2503-C2)-methyltransferase